jgi:hypothetical protein
MSECDLEQGSHSPITAQNKPALKVGYRIALAIADVKEPRVIAETLVKPCAMRMAELMCRIHVRLKITQISLPSKNICDLIKAMLGDKLRQIVKK